MAYFIPQGCTVYMYWKHDFPYGGGAYQPTSLREKNVNKYLGNIEEKETKRIEKGKIEVNKVK